MAHVGKIATDPSGMSDVMETRVFLDNSFLMKIAQCELNPKEQFQLGVFLKLPTSTIDKLIGASEDAVANTFKIFETWLDSCKNVGSSTVLFDQLTEACMEIKRADLVNNVRCEQIRQLSQRLMKAREIAPSCRRKCNEQIRLAKAEERQVKEELQKSTDEIRRLNEIVRQYGHVEETATAHLEERTELREAAAETSIHPEVRDHLREAASTTPASTEERISALETAAEPVDGEDDNDKKLRALHLMSMVREYKQPDLWGRISQHFVLDGALDMSRVLSKANLPDVMWVLASDTASNITKLDFGHNNIFCEEETGQTLGSGLATMSQLNMLRMPECYLTDGSFHHVADGLLRGCQQLTLLNCQKNRLTDAGSEERVKRLLSQIPRLTTVLTSCGLSVECGHRLRIEFGVRFLAF